MIAGVPEPMQGQHVSQLPIRRPGALHHFSDSIDACALAITILHGKIVAQTTNYFYSTDEA